MAQALPRLRQLEINPAMEILQLPETTCLIFAKNLPPIRGELSPWWL